MKATVVGCGVIGLSCAVRLQEAGFETIIVAENLPPDTVSNWAAAIWFPYIAYPEERVTAWGVATYRELKRLVKTPESGVTLTPLLDAYDRSAPDPPWRDEVDGFRRARPDELPSGYNDGYLFEAPVMDSGVYLDYLIRRFRQAGGRIEKRFLKRIGEASGDVVVNCTGLGARTLVGDERVRPIRGQIARVAASGVTRAFADDHGPRAVAYIVPRLNDVVLGGTVEPDVWDTTPDPSTAAAILKKCREIEPALANARLLNFGGGLRPARDEVRLELERLDGLAVVHCYGHGGAGFTLAWGCADEALQLARRACR